MRRRTHTRGQDGRLEIATTFHPERLLAHACRLGVRDASGRLEIASRGLPLPLPRAARCGCRQGGPIIEYPVLGRVAGPLGAVALLAERSLEVGVPSGHEEVVVVARGDRDARLAGCVVDRGLGRRVEAGHRAVGVPAPQRPLPDRVLPRGLHRLTQVRVGVAVVAGPCGLRAEVLPVRHDLGRRGALLDPERKVAARRRDLAGPDAVVVDDAIEGFAGAAAVAREGVEPAVAPFHHHGPLFRAVSEEGGVEGHLCLVQARRVGPGQDGTVDPVRREAGEENVLEARLVGLVHARAAARAAGVVAVRRSARTGLVRLVPLLAPSGLVVEAAVARKAVGAARAARLVVVGADALAAPVVVGGGDALVAVRAQLVVVVVLPVGRPVGEARAAVDREPAGADGREPLFERVVVEPPEFPVTASQPRWPPAGTWLSSP